MSRKHVFDSLAAPPFANLLPCVRQFYGRAGALYTDSQPLRVHGVEFFSSQGARQGCPMGTFLFCLGFHTACMASQHAHPDVMIVLLADDDYTVESVPAKSSVYSPSCDLTCVPPDLPGSPLHPAGRCDGMTVVGVPMGSDAYIEQALACSRAAARPCLCSLTLVRYSAHCDNAVQVQTMLLLKHCANADLNYLRAQCPLPVPLPQLLSTTWLLTATSLLSLMAPLHPPLTCMQPSDRHACLLPWGDWVSPPPSTPGALPMLRLTWMASIPNLRLFFPSLSHPDLAAKPLPAVSAMRDALSSARSELRAVADHMSSSWS
eukprot:5106328-Pleurochrysis_carterae.AAC.1